MQPSSSQNSGDEDPQMQTSEENESHLEENKLIQLKGSLNGNTLVDEVQTTGNKASSGLEPASGSSGIEEVDVITSEKDINKVKKRSGQTLSPKSKKLGVIFSYMARQRPRQPFMTQQTNGRLPAPPSYYSTPRQQEQTQEPTQTQTQRPVIRPAYRYEVPRYIPLGQLSVFPYIMANTAQWASYPSKIPGDVPASLALLKDIEVLFIIQQLDFIELLTGIAEPNFYIILNKNGECLYYAYETSGYCQSCRGLQLHIVDVYQNEVIFMNRPCGCNSFFCCYPAMEVYSPPLVPLGAITKRACAREDFVVTDPDENLMFEIHGLQGCKLFLGYSDVDITIHALDAQRTKVGFIRREFVPNVAAIAGSVDYYGLSFPGNMDVKIKALFLGALFLIDYMYFENNSGDCCCYF